MPKSPSTPAPLKRHEKKPIGEYCSTREAAKLLGVSLGTIQNMVEQGKLEAWKTTGGHRRVLYTSIQALLAGRIHSLDSQAGITNHTGQISILLLDDDEFFLETLGEEIESWGIQADLRTFSNSILALIEMGHRPPDIFLMDLNMPQMDGFEVIRLISERPEFKRMDIIVISSMEEKSIQAKGGLPDHITLMPKPISFEQLRGYFQAKQILQSKRAIA